jgi:hypothetical protein
MTSSFNDGVAVPERSPVVIVLSVNGPVAAMAAKQTKTAREWQLFFDN